MSSKRRYISSASAFLASSASSLSKRSVIYLNSRENSSWLISTSIILQHFCFVNRQDAQCCSSCSRHRGKDAAGQSESGACESPVAHARSRRPWDSQGCPARGRPSPTTHPRVGVGRGPSHSTAQCLVVVADVFTTVFISPVAPVWAVLTAIAVATGHVVPVHLGVTRWWRVDDLDLGVVACHGSNTRTCHRQPQGSAGRLDATRINVDRQIDH